MKFLAFLAVINAADPPAQGGKGAACDPTKLTPGCVDGFRCATVPVDSAKTCVAQNFCGADIAGVKTECSDIGASCSADKTVTGCEKDYSCATAPAGYKNRCVPTTSCNVLTDGITPTCTSFGKKCTSTASDPGCASGYRCATAPPTMKDTCVTKEKCGTKDDAGADVTCAGMGGAECDATAKDKGCGEGKQCATAPPDLKNKCVAKEACGKKMDEVETVCGATTLAAGLVAAIAVASTL